MPPEVLSSYTELCKTRTKETCLAGLDREALGAQAALPSAWLSLLQTQHSTGASLGTAGQGSCCRITLYAKIKRKKCSSLSLLLCLSLE